MSTAPTPKTYVIGIYEDEADLLVATRTLTKEAFDIKEVFSPYPVHGLDDALGRRRSRLPIIAFLFGALGTCLAILMQTSMMTLDWPMIIGGKDYFPLPVFIPVTFEVTVLLAAFGMVGVFFVISNLKPWGKPLIYDLRCTDNKHAIVLALSKDNETAIDKVKNRLQALKAEEINIQQPT